MLVLSATAAPIGPACKRYAGALSVQGMTKMQWSMELARRMATLPPGARVLYIPPGMSRELFLSTITPQPGDVMAEDILLPPLMDAAGLARAQAACAAEGGGVMPAAVPMQVVIPTAPDSFGVKNVPLPSPTPFVAPMPAIVAPLGPTPGSPSGNAYEAAMASMPEVPTPTYLTDKGVSTASMSSGASYDASAQASAVPVKRRRWPWVVLAASVIGGTVAGLIVNRSE